MVALMENLKRTSPLEELLAVRAGKLGRSPDNGLRGDKAWGSDHNAKAMPLWLPGFDAPRGRIWALGTK